MTTMTKVDQGAREQQLATLLAQLDGFMGKDLPTMTATIDELKKALGENVANTKNVVTEIEKIKAQQELVVKNIRSRRGLGYVSGIEDQKFSLIKAMTGARFGFKSSGAEHEEAIMKAAMEAKAAGGQMGNDSLGGFFIPDQVIPEVIAAIYARSVFISLNGDGQTRVSVLDGLVGGNVKIPKIEGGLIAYWIGENEAAAESMHTAGDVTMNPKKIIVMVKLTDSMRRFGGFGFEAMLRNDMARALAEKVDYTLLYGNGSADQPRGLINTLGIKIYSAQSGKYGVLGTDSLAGAQFQADWQGADLTFDVLDNMGLALEEDKISLDATQYTITAPRGISWLRQLKVSNFSGQTADRGYILGLPMLSDARLGDIIGPFDKTPQIPSNNLPGESIGAPTTDTSPTGDLHTDVVRGNLGEVLFGRWSGLEIEDDGGKGLGFSSDHIYIKLRMYADVGVRQARALIVCPDAKVRA